MGVLERRQREREELRSRIVEAAGHLFVEEGFENVSIRKIAEKIEYAPSTIYLYFRDKTELLQTICGDTFEQLNTRLRGLFDDDRDPLDQIRAGARAYIEFGIAHPNHYLVTFCLPAKQDPEHREKMAGVKLAGLQVYDLLRQCVRRGMESGRLTSGDLDTTSQNIWMFMHGTTSLLINSTCQPTFPWAESAALIDSSIEMIVRAIRA